MTGYDQPLEVFVGAMHRHAAHGDVAAEVLAALGEHNAEGARRDFGIFEEELIEIAHPVEQQAIRMGGLISIYCSITGVGRAAPSPGALCSKPVGVIGWAASMTARR